MYSDILFLITARSGSKSVQNKNIRLLGEIPLLGYRVKQALKLTNPDNIWLSTDSQEYADIGKEQGAFIPFLRPVELAADTSNSIDAVLHAMKVAEGMGKSYKYLALLEPTSPFVYTELMVNAIEQLKSNIEAEAIVATRIVNPNSIFVQDDSPYLDILAANLATIEFSGRQGQSVQITPSGGFYIARWDSLKNSRTFYTAKTLSFILPDECALEIDHPIDWQWAEFLLSQKIIDQQKII